MGKPVYVISDREVAEELLNVRGKISAGRPYNLLVMELCVAFPTSNLVIIDRLCPEWAGKNGICHYFRRESYTQRGACLCGKLHLAVPLDRIAI